MSAAIDARVRCAIDARGERARALIGDPARRQSGVASRETRANDSRANAAAIFAGAPTNDAFVDALRADARFHAVGALGARAAAFACAPAVSRVDPSVNAVARLRDECARATAQTRVRGYIKWAWARESVCRGCRATRAERYDEAETCFAQALELDPNHARAYAARGASRANRRKYAAAMEDFDRALSIDGDDARAKAYRDAVGAKMRKIEDERRGRDREFGSGTSGRVVEEDVNALRARVLNPARGLEVLRRGEGAKTYDLELGDGDGDGERDGGGDGDARSSRKKKTDKEKRRRRRKRDSRKDDSYRRSKRDDKRRRKKSSKSSRRDASSSSFSSDSESNS